MEDNMTDAEQLASYGYLSFWTPRPTDPWDRRLLRFGLRSCFESPWWWRLIGFQRGVAWANWWGDQRRRVVGDWWAWWLIHPVRYTVIAGLGWLDRLPRCAICGEPVNTIWGHPPAREPVWYCNVQCAGQADTPLNRRLAELIAAGDLTRWEVT